MLVFLVAICIATAAGVFYLFRMFTRNDTVLGVVGLFILCVAGMAASAYGILNSS